MYHLNGRVALVGAALHGDVKRLFLFSSMYFTCATWEVKPKNKARKGVRANAHAMRYLMF